MKISFTGLNPIPNEDVERNRSNARSLGFPKIGKAGAECLAVVGGGPSIANRLEDLKAWRGDIWAINGAFQWLRARGIDAAFFSIDPTDLIVPDLHGAKHAVLGMCCHPSVFAALRNAKVEAFDVGPYGIQCGGTTATSAVHAGLEYGYRSVTFFGCEGSWGEKFTHAYGNVRPTGGKKPFHDMIRVRCNGEEFLTAPDMVMQTEFLAEAVRNFKTFCFERSGGLLAACVASPEIDVIAGMPDLHQAVQAQQKVADEAA